MRWGVLVLTLGLLASACSDDGGGGGTAAEEGDLSSQTTAPESGCNGTAEVEAGTVRLAHPFGGVDRDVERVIPSTYDGSTPHPMIVSLHGFTSSIEQNNLFSDLPAVAAERGYVLLSPQAEPATIAFGGNAVTGAVWNVGLGEVDEESGLQDDAGFLLDLVETVSAELCVDPDRVYLTGNSNGAGMATALACVAPGVFAAMAPVSGVNLAGQCTHRPLTALIAFHGDADPLVPYDGGSPARTGWTNPAVEESVSSWAVAAGCAAEPQVAMPFDDIELQRWVGCDDGLDVELYRVLGGGHTWPGMLNYVDAGALAELAADQPLVEVADLDLAAIAGHMTVSIEATQLMVDFFDEHTLG
jgi:polyhydroxybutyrate depolymerase